MNPEFEKEGFRDVDSSGEATLEIAVNRTETDLEPRDASIIETKAQRFVEGLQKGLKPSAAAKNIGTSLTRIRNSKEMTHAIQELNSTYSLSAEVRKLMVRAGLNKLFIENIDSKNPKDLKIALEAGKLISEDEEVKIRQDQSVIINMESGLDERIKNITLTGIEEIQEERT